MTDTKWTPGPWFTEGPDQFFDFNIHHQTDRLAIGAVVSNLRPLGEVNANATLIAAAPESIQDTQTLARIFEKYESQGIATGLSDESNIAITVTYGDLRRAHRTWSKVRDES